MDRYQTRTAPTDAVLVSQTRRGDHHAYRTLVARHHEAVRLAALLLGGPSTLVRATFDAAHGCLVRDAGSAGAVRPYLLQLAHRLHQTPDPVDDLVRGDAVDCTPFRESVPTAHPSLAAEVSWLPHSWQAVLWHRLVERDGDDAVAAAVGVPPGKVPLLVDGGLDLIRRNLVARHRKGHHRSAWPTGCGSSARTAGSPGRCCATPTSALGARACSTTSRPSTPPFPASWPRRCWARPGCRTWRREGLDRLDQPATTPPAGDRLGPDNATRLHQNGALPTMVVWP